MSTVLTTVDVRVPPSAAAPDPERLPRRLGVWSAAAVLVGSDAAQAVFGAGGAAVAAGLGIAFVSLRSFEELTSAFVLGIWPFCALAVGGGFLLGAVAMLLSAALHDTVPTLIGFGVILLGIPVFYLWRGRNGQGIACSDST